MANEGWESIVTTSIWSFGDEDTHRNGKHTKAIEEIWTKKSQQMVTTIYAVQPPAIDAERSLWRATLTSSTRLTYGVSPKNVYSLPHLDGLMVRGGCECESSAGQNKVHQTQITNTWENLCDAKGSNVENWISLWLNHICEWRTAILVSVAVSQCVNLPKIDI